jgi:hypothetical protein
MTKDRATEAAYFGEAHPVGTPPGSTAWFGHPRGLGTLFFT